MRTGLLALLVSVSAANAWAHPGWGIVQDSKGNVYFTDTRQVWKVLTDGKVSVAVPNVHTHELCIDAEDNLCVYIAAAAERLVLRVDGGKLSSVAQPAAPWAPSGGMIDRDGALWILEYDTANAVRVRRIDRTGQERMMWRGLEETAK